MKHFYLILFSAILTASCHKSSSDKNDAENVTNGSAMVDELALAPSEDSAAQSESSDCEGEAQHEDENGVAQNQDTAVIEELPIFVDDTAEQSSDESVQHETHEDSQASDQDLYVYFRCNATSWSDQLDDVALLTPDGEGYSLTVNITEGWMVEFGDACNFTVTDRKGEWTANTREYVASAHPILDSQSYAAVSAVQTGYHAFRMKYSALGSYVVYFNPKQMFFTVMPKR